MATMGSNLEGKVGEVRMTVEVKRAATGLTETHELVGYLDAEQVEKLKEVQIGCNT
jgi:hypothetical protein